MRADYGLDAPGVVRALALVAGLAACSNDPLADQYRSGDGKGFIAADGFEVVPIPEAERTEPVDFEGVLDTGGTTSSADYRGEVLVVNFWYAACAPCRVEAPILEEVNQLFEGEEVDFLGVNLYDGAEASQAFAETSCPVGEIGLVETGLAGDGRVRKGPL